MPERGLTLIVGDSWRYDHFSQEATPHIWDLAQRGQIYRNHYSRGHETSSSTLALLGPPALARREGYPIKAIPGSVYLFALNRPSLGRSSFLFAGINRVVPWSSQFSLSWNQNFWRRSEIGYWMDPGNPVRAYRVALDAFPSLSFAYLHCLQPHRPYTPEGRWWDWEALDYSYNPEDPLHQEQARARKEAYREAVGIFDGIVHQFHLMAQERKLIITGDHGEALGEEGEWGHKVDREETLHIPLILCDPKNPYASEDVAELTFNDQIMPTVLKWMNIDPGEEEPIEIEFPEGTAQGEPLPCLNAFGI